MELPVLIIAVVVLCEYGWRWIITLSWCLWVSSISLQISVDCITNIMKINWCWNSTCFIYLSWNGWIINVHFVNCYSVWIENLYYAFIRFILIMVYIYILEFHRDRLTLFTEFLLTHVVYLCLLYRCCILEKSPFYQHVISNSIYQKCLYYSWFGLTLSLSYSHANLKYLYSYHW